MFVPDDLRRLAREVASYPDGVYRFFLGEIRRQKRSLRLGKPVKRVVRSSVRRDARDVKTSLAVRDRDGWQCRSCKRQFTRPGSGELAVGETSGLTNAHVIPRRFLL